MAVVGRLGLVLQDLTVELVGEGVDGRVEVGIFALDVDVLATHVDAP